MSKIAFQMRNVGIYPTESADAHLVVLGSTAYRDFVPSSGDGKPVSAACCMHALEPAVAWGMMTVAAGVQSPNSTASHVIAVNADALYGYTPDELDAIFYHEYGHFHHGHTTGSLLGDDPVTAELEADSYSASRVGNRTMLRALCRTKVRVVEELLRLNPDEELPPFSVYKRRAVTLMGGLV